MSTTPLPAAPATLPRPPVWAMPTVAGLRDQARRAWRPALLAGLLVLSWYGLRARLPGAAATWATLAGSRPLWLAAAATAQVVSMAAFAEQQRHLLAAFGVRMPARAALSLTYTRSAMSTALPAGSAVSAGYAFRRYRSYGASQSVAAAVMVLSGVVSAAGLALLYAADALAFAAAPAVPLVLGGAAAALAGTLATYRWRRRTGRGATARAATGHGATFAHQAPGAVAPSRAGAGGTDGAAPSPVQRLRHAVRTTAALGAGVPAHRWVLVVAVAALNWLTDLACLVAATHAVGVSVGLRTLATGYLVTQLVRQVPVTPGGVGLIEAALLLTLTGAGVGAVPAAAAVLVYRVMSCWSVLPVGLACHLVGGTSVPGRRRGGAPGGVNNACC
jgi:uncharacterized membrane protein YbhN (UPF0104 family)